MTNLDQTKLNIWVPNIRDTKEEMKFQLYGNKFGCFSSRLVYVLATVAVENHSHIVDIFQLVFSQLDFEFDLCLIIDHLPGKEKVQRMSWDGIWVSLTLTIQFTHVSFGCWHCFHIRSMINISIQAAFNNLIWLSI